jgi:methanogenic corrinoid protein MtbC1
MYTIKQAAARTGLTVPTIRAWERRYGVVAPARTAAGYRLYDDAAIARLVAMRQLVDIQGWRPSQAAERVVAAGEDVTSLGPGVDGAIHGGSPTGSARPTQPAIQAFVAAARDLDTTRMQSVLDESFAAQRFELAMEGVVFPALRAIGEGWSNDEVDVAVEHAASETVRRRLAHFYDAVGRAGSTPLVIVGLPPGCFHELGAFAFAVAGRRAGLDVLYLGADVPLESWLRSVRETRAATVVLGVVTAADVPAATAVVEALRTLAQPPRCLLGGPLARGVPAGTGAEWLPDALDAATATVGARSEAWRPQSA